MSTAPAIRLIPEGTAAPAADLAGTDLSATDPQAASAVWVAFSGGLDSTVLLHRLAHDPTIRDRGLRAIHVHHGLHERADAWAEHCSERCLALGIALDVVKVEVGRDSGLGPEAAARQARRQAFAQTLRSGGTLALAQHRDDQAETFLLRALRASGPDGLASMRPWQRFADGWMWRPLLDTSREALAAYAAHHGLRWIEDPSNANTALDRNFLRHRVLPLLRERWPHADAAFARSAALAEEASGLLAAQDETLLASVRDEDSGSALSVPALRALPAAQRARLLRHWVSALGWPPLPAKGIARIKADLLGSDSVGPVDGQTPRFAWRSVEIRRWRDALHAIDAGRTLPPSWSRLWDGREPLVLPNGDTLTLQGAEGFPAPLRAHARCGGERILLAGREHRHSLKHVFQTLDVAPWERARMPLLSSEDGILLAAGDRIRSADFGEWLASRGARLAWSGR